MKITDWPWLPYVQTPSNDGDGVLSLRLPAMDFRLQYIRHLQYGGVMSELFRGTNMQWMESKKGGLPMNALNQRVSAHFTEINSIYGVEMLKRVMAS